MCQEHTAKPQIHTAKPFVARTAKVFVVCIHYYKNDLWERLCEAGQKKTRSYKEYEITVAFDPPIKIYLYGADDPITHS